MILAIGIDIVNINGFDVEAHKRHFTEYENRLAMSRPTMRSTYAKRLAVKEAIIKALGVDDSLGDVKPSNIEVRMSLSGRPIAILDHAAREQMLRISPHGQRVALHVSISDDGPMAIAIAIIEALPGDGY